ncbi:MAG: chloride channel protein [Leptolyngbya sp. SIOISBB]|nr:chloride channel protein [Leptolyngbya sp. SIOISBB]
MKPIGYARSREYWIRFGWGTLMGLIGAVVAFVYVIIVHGLEHILWHDDISITPFAGSVQIVIITTLAGLVVGIIHKIMPTEEVDVFGAIAQGDMDLTHAMGAIMASVVSLAGGFALGPEAPTGILAGGVGVWISKKRGLPKAIVRTNLFSSVAGAFAGLFTAPFGIILMGLELKHRQSPYYYGTLMIIAVASILGFTVFYAAGGNRFSAVLRLLELPPYELGTWHVLVGVLLGLIAVVFAFGFAVLMKILQQLMAPLHARPILRCTGIGLLIGLLGMAMPITLFLGTESLATVVAGRQDFALGFLLLSAVLKILAVTLVLAGGFIGGPIFPLLFVGGTVGIAIWQLFPGLPVMMTVGCMMAAVPCALVPFPATLAVIVLLITGTPVVNAIPVLTAALTAHFVLKGMVLSDPIATGQRLQDIDAALQEEADDVPPEAIA